MAFGVKHVPVRQAEKSGVALKRTVRPSAPTPPVEWGYR